MASSSLSFEQIFYYFRENGNVVKNRDIVHHFRAYLTHSASRDDARAKFRAYVNTLAQTKTENGDKYLILKTKYQTLQEPPQPPLLPPHPQHSPQPPPPYEINVHSPQDDPRNSIGIPILSSSPSLISPSAASRQPPPYRPPPRPSGSSSSPCPSVMSLDLDNLSLGSSSLATTPLAPPRTRKISSGSSSSNIKKSLLSVNNASGTGDNEDNSEELTVSVKERMEKFNRLASVEDEGSSPSRTPKGGEKKIGKGADEDDGASVTSLEPKKCVEWCVTASKGDLQELAKLAKDEPRLVHRKDPFTTVLHWGAKHGNVEIIKTFAGRYKVDVNGKTNGGYTPLHLAAQFGHEDVFKILISVYKADSKIRDYSGRLPDYYLISRKSRFSGKENVRKLKDRKKQQADKDLGFLRIGSLNVRVKKTTEAFSNYFLGGASINPLDPVAEKMHKGWGSADNLNNNFQIRGGANARKKTKRPYSTTSPPPALSPPTGGSSSNPGTPRQGSRSNMFPNVNNSNHLHHQDSDSDSAAGFDSQWKN